MFFFVIAPPEERASEASSGRNIATTALLLRKEDRMETVSTSTIMSSFSFRPILLTMALPIISAAPVSNTALPSMRTEATIMTVSEPKGATTSEGSMMPKIIMSREPTTAVRPAGRLCMTKDMRITTKITDARIGFITKHLRALPGRRGTGPAQEAGSARLHRHVRRSL